MIYENFKKQIEIFWNANFVDGHYYCCNYKWNYDGKSGFSKSFFVTNSTELSEWAWENRNRDCYINYNPLKTDINRKNENVFGLHVVALDIEFADKQKPESSARIHFLHRIVKEAMQFRFDIENFMIVCSGNGVHFYAPIGKTIRKDLNVLKAAYNRFVKHINAEINYYISKHNVEISMDDRKDLAGILRIPGTMNQSASRLVQILEYSPNGSNEKLRKKFFSSCRKAQKQMEKLAKIRENWNPDDYDVPVPKTFEEIEKHVITQMIFDMDLPEVEGWHSTVGFAMQAIVKFSGVPYYPDIQVLEAEINSTWESSLSLQHCNADNPWGPLKGAYNFCVKNGEPFKKYADALGKLLRRSK